MHLRAFIVLLIVMNLGVALWWALSAGPDAAPAAELPADVPRLQLVSEAGPDALQAAALNAANATADEPLAGTDADADADAQAEAEAPGVDDLEGLQCFSFGPWPDAADAQPALVALGARAERVRTREVATGASGWRVMLPPVADRSAAQEAVAGLVEAGFDDHFIIGQGEEANAVALGRFGSEPAARRHEAALREAGFQAVAEPLGATGSETWIDLAAGEGFDAGQAREDAGAARSGPVDCDRLQ